MYTFASQTLSIINVILVNLFFALTADFVEIISHFRAGVGIIQLKSPAANEQCFFREITTKKIQ